MVNEMRVEFHEYDELLIQTQKILAIKDLTERAQWSLFNLIKSTESMGKQETEWIRNSTELAALRPGIAHGWFAYSTKDCMNSISRRMTRILFTTGTTRRQAGSEEIQLTSLVRRDAFLQVILTVLASIMLFDPVRILPELQPSHPSEMKRKSNLQILTILAFILMFRLGRSIFTRAGRQEVSFATAAYAAVLVIFLGQTSNVVVPASGLLRQERRIS